jgi:Tfp pilus assembly protein PilZ
MKGSDRYFVDGVICRLHGQDMRVGNMSVSGLFAATENPLPAGQVVELELQLGDRPPFTVLARVTWVNDPAAPRAPHLPQGFGVQITRIALPDKLAIVDLLKRMASEDRAAR